MTTTARELLPATRNALALLLLSMADDEFVIGFSDSEWTGIAPLLEEDVAISSLAQDELGHAQALYRVLVDVVSDGRDADNFAYDRPADGYYHARLLDHPRGDWADTIARRYLYDTADGVRLAALADSSFTPLAELVGKVRREERYHLMHVTTWFERLAATDGEPRRRLLDSLDRLAADAGTVLTPLPTELALEMAGIIDAPFSVLEQRWRDQLAPVFSRLDLPLLPATRDPEHARTAHSDAFRWLHDEFTSVRRLDPAAPW
jgi:ring-1,2-phenylacetyl-CoA epoxidase subunit PaaC